MTNAIDVSSSSSPDVLRTLRQTTVRTWAERTWSSWGKDLSKGWCSAFLTVLKIVTVIAPLFTLFAFLGQRVSQSLFSQRTLGDLCKKALIMKGKEQDRVCKKIAQTMFEKFFSTPTLLQKNQSLAHYGLSLKKFFEEKFQELPHKDIRSNHSEPLSTKCINKISECIDGIKNKQTEKEDFPVQCRWQKKLLLNKLVTRDSLGKNQFQEEDGDDLSKSFGSILIKKFSEFPEIESTEASQRAIECANARQVAIERFEFSKNNTPEIFYDNHSDYKNCINGIAIHLIKYIEKYGEDDKRIWEIYLTLADFFFEKGSKYCCWEYWNNGQLYKNKVENILKQPNLYFTQKDNKKIKTLDGKLEKLQKPAFVEAEKQFNEIKPSKRGYKKIVKPLLTYMKMFEKQSTHEFQECKKMILQFLYETYLKGGDKECLVLANSSEICGDDKNLKNEICYKLIDKTLNDIKNDGFLQNLPGLIGDNKTIIELLQRLKILGKSDPKLSSNILLMIILYTSGKAGGSKDVYNFIEKRLKQKEGLGFSDSDQEVVKILNFITKNKEELIRDVLPKYSLPENLNGFSKSINDWKLSAMKNLYSEMRERFEKCFKDKKYSECIAILASYKDSFKTFDTEYPEARYLMLVVILLHGMKKYEYIINQYQEDKFFKNLTSNSYEKIKEKFLQTIGYNKNNEIEFLIECAKNSTINFADNNNENKSGSFQQQEIQKQHHSSADAQKNEDFNENEVSGDLYNTLQLKNTLKKPK